MKTYINIIIGAFFVLILGACEQPNLNEGYTDKTNGLLNVSIQIPGESSEYSATKKGPYAEGEEITVKVPTTEEDPLDLTKLKCIANIENDCYVETPLGKDIDFTNPYQITVIDSKGNRHTNTIRIIPTMPKTVFKELWVKTALDLNLPGVSCSGIAINDKYLAVQMYDGDIYLFNKTDGSFAKKMPAATTFMMQIRTDDANHFVASRENIYSAGFMVYYYPTVDSEPILLLNFKADYNCPSDMGYKMNVIGDVSKGKAFIYGIAPSDMTIYFWQLQDGKLVTPEDQPNKIRYSGAGGAWNFAQVQRASLDDNSDYYFTYFKSGDDDDEDSPKRKGSRFSIFSPSTMEGTEMNCLNHSYKILDFHVFEINGDKFLVTSEQGMASWGYANMKVFEITDKTKWSMSSDDAGYDKFLIYDSDGSYPVNYNKWGDVATQIDGNTVYMAASVVGWEKTESTIRMYKMTYYPQ